MGKSNIDDEEIELKCRTNEENNIDNDLLKENTENLKLIANNSMDGRLQNGNLRDDSQLNLLNAEVRSHKDTTRDSAHDKEDNSDEDNQLSTDNLHIKQPFRDVDLTDKEADLNGKEADLTDRPQVNEPNNQTNDTSNQSSSSPNILTSDKLDAYLNQNEILTNSIKLFRSEFRRLSFNEKYWRYTSFNKNFTLCSTYPPYFIIPAQFVDDDLSEVAKFRHIGRLPSVVYRHRNGAVIVRSSQPSVGLLSRRSTEDEKLLQLILTNCIQDQTELIEKSSLSSFEENNKLANCDCCSSNSTPNSTPKLNGHSQSSNNFNLESSTSSPLTNQTEYQQPQQEKYCNCKCHSQDVVINSKNCQPTQSSKFFSLSDKILENIMSYTSYTEVPNNQPTTTNNSSTDKKLLILDARSFTVAFLNRAFGGGSECSEYYPNCEVDYLYLANIHAVRTAFFSLKTLIRSNDNQYNPPNN